MPLTFCFASDLPSRTTLPLLGFTMPAMPLRVVVLPAPLRPRIVTISPSPTVRQRLCTTSIGPYAIDSSRTSSIRHLEVTEVHALHFGLVEHDVRDAMSDVVAGGEHVDLLCSGAHDGHVVLDQHDREAELVTKVQHQCRELRALVGTHAGCRL